MNIPMYEEKLKENLAKNIRLRRLTHNPRITQAELAKKQGITHPPARKERKGTKE